MTWLMHMCHATHSASREQLPMPLSLCGNTCVRVRGYVCVQCVCVCACVIESQFDLSAKTFTYILFHMYGFMYEYI